MPRSTTRNLPSCDEVFKLDSEIAYTVVLDDQNKVKAIEGTEKLLEKAEKLDPTARECSAANSNADKLKRVVRARARHPAGRPGPARRALGADRDRRNRRRSDVHLPQEVRVAGTEKKGDKTLDKITSKVHRSHVQAGSGPNSPLKVVKSNLKVESSDGTILFDREAGHVVEQ